jgi:uncharacterized protein YjcR
MKLLQILVIIRKSWLKLLLLFTLANLTGCASLDIKPWVKPYQRQHLADKIMAKSRHPIANMHIAHVYEARESARGAEGTGGGGCGCN